MVDRIGGVEILEPDYAGGSVITVQGSTPKLQVTGYETEELSKLLNGVRYGIVILRQRQIILMYV